MQKKEFSLAKKAMRRLAESRRKYRILRKKEKNMQISLIGNISNISATHWKSDRTRCRVATRRLRNAALDHMNFFLAKLTGLVVS
jgi:hypothetical protein